ncbi:MAG: GNAT family N-acetyltransferase [Treponema sp.]|nr:GNAT family N-acetyltransferase [Treponema sp.]
MQFELTEALLDDILFSMEDQEGDFYIDCREGVVVNWDDYSSELGSDTEERFISLPDWDSSSGFRLMERFAAAFRNPLIRNELCVALNRGKGVFRAFKNVLSLRPEAEKLWFSFKEREMKREVIRWYNGLREEWGLKKIGFEPEETADLVLEDFRFREIKDEDKPAAAELHRLCMGDTAPGLTTDNIESSFSFVAETGHDEFAGYISALHNESGLYINALEVKPEYRGLGVGKALLNHLLEKVKAGGSFSIIMDLPAEAEGFSRVLVREGFLPRMIRYSLTSQ